MTLTAIGYDALDAARRARLLPLVQPVAPERFTSAEALEAQLGGMAYEGGRLVRTLWAGDEPVAVLGLIVREVAQRGVAFLFPAIAPNAALFQALLAEVPALLPPGCDRLLLAARPPAAPIGAIAFGAGFTPAHETLELVWDGVGGDVGAGPLTFSCVTPVDAKPYAAITSAAFRDTPSGATLTEAEARELLASVARPEHVGLARLGDIPVAAYFLTLAGEVGTIEALAMDPAHQGHGLGKHLLAHAITVLVAGGATRVDLAVASTNTAALALYARAGFDTTRVLTRWYGLPTVRPTGV